MAAHPRSLSGLSRLVLISAASLLILGLLTLGLALRNAEAFAREEARTRAVRTLEALRADLRLPSLLNLLGESTRFQILDGTLIVPEGIASLDARTRDQDTEFREEALRNRLDPIQNRQGLDRVLTVIEEELQQREVVDVSTLLLMNEGAWRAQNAISANPASDPSLVERRDNFLQGYDTARFKYEARTTNKIPVLIDRSAFLLRARAGWLAPDWSRELLAALAPREGEALTDRAAELSPGSFSRSQFKNTLLAMQKLWAQRALLEQIRSRVGSLLGRKKAWHRIEGSQILLWYPAPGSQPSGKEEGQGALVDQDHLLARLRAATGDAMRAAEAGLLPIAWLGTLLRQEEAPSHGLAVWEGLWLLPESPTSTGFGGQPWFLGLLFVTVFILLIVGLWQILGSMKRERAAMALRSEFLTSVTHELKTPLSSIRLFTEMLADDRVASEEKRSQYHRLLAGEATRLSALVENVLDLGRMERGERSYDLRREDLIALVDEAVELFRPIAQAQGMTIRCADTPGEARFVNADRTALMQALLNLFENARKYASSGRQIDLQWEEGENGARLWICDQGPGIPPAERERVFERFRRGESQNDGAIPGVGLGLYLARRILRAHGGDLQIVDPPPDSKRAEPQGACLLLRLPLDPNPSTSPETT